MSSLLDRIKRRVFPGKHARRSYDGGASNRFTPEPGISTSSADSELGLSLTPLRNRSRNLVRNNGHAKRIRRIIEQNVIKTGVGYQSDIKRKNGEPIKRMNSEKEEEWKRWCEADSCHVAGLLHFSDLERIIIGEEFEGGEIFIRLHRRPFGRSRVPLALELIEPERIADEYQVPSPMPGNVIRLGIEQDYFGRPQAYWINSIYPGETRIALGETAKLERVPASDIIHLYKIDRWPQSRGVPWLHAAIRKLQDIGGYTQAEIIAARASANYMGFITSDEAPSADDDQEIYSEPGEVKHLKPGESFTPWSPNRPNSASDPFLRLMLREVSVANDVDYPSLTGDYSQTNYSSTRLQTLDTRDMWRVLQLSYIRAFRVRLNREWSAQAATFGALPSEHLDLWIADPRRYESSRYLPRGWHWVDPTKEVGAYKEAERAMYMTKTDIIAETAGGQDLDDLIATRKREIEMLEAAGIQTDTTDVAPPPDPVAPKQDDDDEDSDDDDDEERSNVRHFSCL